MSEAGGPCRGPAADALNAKNTTVGMTVQGRDDVMVVRYGKAFRWYPNPESRKGGSRRWAVPSVSEWHPAASIAEIGATFKAQEWQ